MTFSGITRSPTEAITPARLSTRAPFHSPPATSALVVRLKAFRFSSRAENAVAGQPAPMQITCALEVKSRPGSTHSGSTALRICDQSRSAGQTMCDAES